MAVQEYEATPKAIKPVPVPRSLRHSFTNRSGLPTVSGARVPPALTRALAVWLETGSILVVAAPRGSGKSAVIAAWLSTRAERIAWIEGSENRESGEGLDAALEGLYEIGILSRFERMTFTGMRDLNDAFLRESTPVVMVLNNSHLLTDVPSLKILARRASHWPSTRFVLLTDNPVDPSLLPMPGVTVLGANDLRDPLEALIDMPLTEFRSGSEVVEDWARQRDESGGLFQLLQYLSQFLSVPREAIELDFVDDVDGAIAELLAHRVVELISAPDGQRISLVPEFRDALDSSTSSQPGGTGEAFHLAAASDSANIGYDEGVIFHLARAGRHAEALEALPELSTVRLSTRDRLDSLRNAAVAIDLTDPTNGIAPLTKRLLIALIPPFESSAVREEIQQALRRAQDRAVSPLPPALDADLTVAHVVGLLALGRFNEARVLGRPLADSMLATPWLDLASLGAVPTRVWVAQATAELLEGRIEDAARFGSVARESAIMAKIPYHLYTSTAAVAAIEAVKGELVIAERYLTEAQRLYREGGWPRTVSQTAEFVARFFLARASLDVSAMSDLRQDIAVLPEVNGSLRLLMKACECFVYLHSGQAARTRVGLRQLAMLIRDPESGALFRGIGAETVFEALLRLGEPGAAIDIVEMVGAMDPDGRCLRPLLGAASLELRDPARALLVTDDCVGVNSHHTPGGQALVLLVRAGAHELLGSTELADECFKETLLLQESSPVPYLFLMVPGYVRMRLWDRVDEQRPWLELRAFLGTVPESIGSPDDQLPRARLTAREMEILRALSIGGTLEEIALSHFLSRNTIKSHVRTIYKKLHVETRSGAAEIMKRFGEQLMESGTSTQNLG